VRDPGAPGPGNTIAPGTVLAQYVFEPYGGVALSETLVDSLATELTNTLGHQGLHFIRLDDTSPAANTLTPAARGLYYNRNRFYSPDLGRFITRDPNATALPILTAAARNGQALDILIEPLDGNALFADGMNLYLYAGANPISGNDPLGLFLGLGDGGGGGGYDYYDFGDDDFADAIYGALGTNMAAIGAINEGARVAAIGLNMALEITGGLLGIDVLQSVAVLANGQGGFWDSMNVLMAVNPVGRVGKVVGKAARIASRGRGGFKIIGTILEHVGKRGRYKNLQKLTRGKRGAIQAHHIAEKRFANLLRGRPHPNDMPAVILTDQQHTKITSELFKRLHTNRRYTKKDLPEIWQKYQEVYTQLGYAEWLQDIEHYFR